MSTYNTIYFFSFFLDCPNSNMMSGRKSEQERKRHGVNGDGIGYHRADA